MVQFIMLIVIINSYCSSLWYACYVLFVYFYWQAMTKKYNSLVLVSYSNRFLASEVMEDVKSSHGNLHHVGFQGLDGQQGIFSASRLDASALYA